MDELSYLTLQLVRVCKSYQRKSLGLNTALAALLHETPDVRAALTENRMRDMLTVADEGATVIVDNEFAELEKALLDGTDFRSALRAYLDKNL
jgi:hypothetical protein